MVEPTAFEAVRSTFESCRPSQKEKQVSTLKDMVKNKKVRFQYYREGELWYVTEDGFAFPVPTADIGNATFFAEDKALLFMRYIRKHLEHIDQARKDQTSS